MSEWIGAARSNYFKVNNAEAFKLWASSRSLKVWEQKWVSGDRYGITPELEDGDGGWPNSVWSEDADEDIFFEVAEELASYVAEDDVAILIEIGSDRLKYLTGRSVAVTCKGILERVNVDDIYALVAQHGFSNVNTAEY